MASRVLLPGDLSPYLKNILRQCTSRKRKTLNIGVCVSGGPDSMALAYLLSKLQHEQPHEFQLSAWIVDHKARPESTHEAEQVRQNLSKIGVESRILTMYWPIDTNPLQLSDFESQARTKRYELLANAARRNYIKHLFLGHHQDDQIETILMRLIRNHNMSLNGLAGMASHASLPGAFDMFGTHVEDRGVSLSAHASFPPSYSMSESQSSPRHGKKFKVAMPGGISLERPLLPFKKADLIATCESNEVPFVVDPTNKDPQSSLRNAVRHLRTHYNLPKALGSERIMQLQQRAKDRLSHVEQTGHTVLSACSITSLDLRSGVMKVKLPDVQNEDLIDSDANAFALSKLAEVVTPNVRVNNNALAPARFTSQFFIKHNFNNSNLVSTQSRPIFHYDKVQFSPDPRIPDSWILHRQPMRESEILENTLNFDRDLNFVTKVGLASRYLLWDNRFWIRVYTSADILSELQVRPYQKGDMANIKMLEDSDAGKSRRRLSEMLKDAGEGKIRYTLPVLTFQDHVVAFPTLRYRFKKHIPGTQINHLDWDIIYNSFSLLDRLSGSSH